MSKIKIITWRHNDGQLKSKTPYKNNQRHGMEKWWYENGKPWSEVSFQNGKLHGIGIWWHSDGEQAYKHYYLYNKETTEEEYRKHILIESLACLK